jgi:hypothetical protein
MDDNVLLHMFSEQNLVLAEQSNTLKEQSAVLAQTSQSVKDLKVQLLGDGQPGELQKFTMALIDHTGEDKTSFDNIGTELSEIKLGIVGRKRWLAGAVAVILAEATVLGWLVTHHFNLLH